MNPANIHDRFFSGAPKLRREFLERFEDQGSSKRFVWDYWHVPDQYTLLRTPAYHFFSRALYKRFHESLLKFGREQLGCYDVTPPWLSYYVEGCRQELHADVPHGPWAFVFSLTEWQARSFTGGETLLLKASTLDYWRHFSDMNGVEQKDLVQKIPPKFNRLLVFDPRFPHGVTPVHGVHDPRQARVVIHGWFTDPEPYVTGALTRRQATLPINEILKRLEREFQNHSHLHGSLSVRFNVARGGSVSNPRLLTNTLISREGRSPNPFLARLKGTLLSAAFPRATGSSTVTLPIVFR